jgi:ATP-dependent DNA ligase
LLVARSCIIDGEAVACDDNGITSFNRVRYRYHDESIFLCRHNQQVLDP